MTPQQKVKLAGSLDFCTCRKKPDCLTHYVSAIYRDIPDIFAAVDRAPKFLQGDRKSFVYASK